MALPNQTHLDKTNVSVLQRILNESRRTVQCVEYRANRGDEKIKDQVLSNDIKRILGVFFLKFFNDSN